MAQSYFAVTVEGNIIHLGSFDNEQEAENAAAEYGSNDTCEACEHAPDDTVYWGTREHFNAMFDQLELQA